MKKETVKPLLLIGGGIAAYETYQLYKFYEAFELSFGNIKMAFKNGGLLISFDAVINNPTATAMDISSVTGSVRCFDRSAQKYNGLYFNYQSKKAGNFSIKPRSISSIPIEILLKPEDTFKLVEIATLSKVSIDIFYDVSVNYKVFSLIGISVTIPAKESIDPKPYIDKIKGIYNMFAEFIRRKKNVE